MLPALLRLAKTLVAAAGLQAEPAVAPAVFHTLASLLGPVLMLPAIPSLTRRWLRQRHRSGAGDRARPRHPDQNMLATPALEALKLELARILEMARTPRYRHGEIAFRRGQV